MNTELLHGFLIGCAFFGIGFVLERIHRKINRHKKHKKLLKKTYEEFLYKNYVRCKNLGTFKGSFEEYKEHVKTGVFGNKGPS